MSQSDSTPLTDVHEHPAGEFHPPIMVTGARFARRLERDRAALIAALQEVSYQLGDEEGQPKFIRLVRAALAKAQEPI